MTAVFLASAYVTEAVRLAVEMLIVTWRFPKVMRELHAWGLYVKHSRSKSG